MSWVINPKGNMTKFLRNESNSWHLKRLSEIKKRKNPYCSLIEERKKLFLLPGLGGANGFKSHQWENNDINRNKFFCKMDWNKFKSIGCHFKKLREIHLGCSPYNSINFGEEYSYLLNNNKQRLRKLSMENLRNQNSRMSARIKDIKRRKESAKEDKRIEVLKEVKQVKRTQSAGVLLPNIEERYNRLRKKYLHES